MQGIATLGYCVFEVSNLDTWETFATDVIGFQAGERTPDRLDLRMDELRMRVQLELGPDDDLKAAGWVFDTERDLVDFVDGARRSGVDVSELGSETARRRSVEAVFGIEDPNGFRHELAFGPSAAPLSQPFRSKVLVGTFVTGALGFGHLLPVSKDYAGTVSFYRDILGLRISDFIRQELAPGIVADATFFHTRTGRHHSLATAALPGNKRLNHAMVQTTTLDDVGLALDRCHAAGVRIMMGMGHHPNDRMTSFYAVTPSGFSLEFGWGGIVIDDDDWEVRTYSQLSDWGHARGAR